MPKNRVGTDGQVGVLGGEWGFPLGVHPESSGSPGGGTAGSWPCGAGGHSSPLCEAVGWKPPHKGPGRIPSPARAAGSVPQYRLQGVLGQGWAMTPGPSTLLSLGESGGAGPDSRGRGALLSPDSSPGDPGVLGVQRGSLCIPGAAPSALAQTQVMGKVRSWTRAGCGVRAD